MTHLGEPPNPGRFFEVLNAYQRTAALTGAIELDLFTAIGEGNTTAAAIAQRVGGTERGVRILCDYLTIIGIIEKREGAYALPADAALFLDKRSPAYLGGISRFIASPEMRAYFDDVAGLVRKGGTVAERESVAPDHPMWVEFARSMAPMMHMPASVMAELLDDESGRAIRVLDIAAGHGLFGIGIAQRNPRAQIVAVDWAAVLAVASENAGKFGVADRFNMLAGSAFEVEFGTGYDLALLTNFLHHFDRETCVGLLRKVRASLVPGGRVATLEFVPNDDRVTPPLAAAFSMTMLGTTEHGDAYTFAELEGMARDAGFTRSEAHVVTPGVQSLVISSV